MFHAVQSITLSGIMMVMSYVVNAQAADSPNFNQTLHKGKTKTTKSDRNEFSRIVEMIMTTGGTDRLKPGLAELIGLKGEPPVKGLDNSTPHADGREYRECSAVYAENIDDKSDSDKRHPICIYFNKMVSSGHNVESHWYRVTLDGKLEKAVIHYNKLDDNNEGIPGADSTVIEDIDSPKVQKSFKSELAFWLKKQKMTTSKSK